MMIQYPTLITKAQNRRFKTYLALRGSNKLSKGYQMAKLPQTQRTGPSALSNHIGRHYQECQESVGSSSLCDLRKELMRLVPHTIIYTHWLETWTANEDFCYLKIVLAMTNDLHSAFAIWVVIKLNVIPCGLCMFFITKFQGSEFMKTEVILWGPGRRQLPGFISSNSIKGGLGTHKKQYFHAPNTLAAACQRRTAWQTVRL